MPLAPGSLSAQCTVTWSVAAVDLIGWDSAWPCPAVTAACNSETSLSGLGRFLPRTGHSEPYGSCLHGADAKRSLRGGELLRALALLGLVVVLGRVFGDTNST